MKYNTNNIQFTQDKTQPETIIITVENEYYNTERIGRFNFYTKDGWLILQNGTKKEYTQWKSLFNNFFKMNEMFGWTSTEIDNAIEYGKQLLKAEKLQYAEDLKAKQLERAIEYIEKLKNKTIQLADDVTSKTETELASIVNGSFKHLLPVSVVAEVVKAIKDSAPVEVVEVEVVAPTIEDETYIVGNRAFTTYQQAVEYCIGSDYDIEMLMSI